MQDKVIPAHRTDPINWPMTLFIISLHVGAVAAFFNFSWAALGVAYLLAWIGGGLGIGVGYHRMLSHRAFEAPKLVEYFLTICGAIALQGGPIAWAAKHRMHHGHTETADDPHSPRHGLWWSHFGWIMQGKSDNREVESLLRQVPDLAKDRFHLWISRWNFVPQLFVIAILYLIGGWQFVLWGFFARVVYTWHVAFLVNSVGHVWGSRRFDTPDDSTNNWWLALLNGGEGWGNNHHAYPMSARHAMAWYEFDGDYYLIWILRKLGLVKNVRVARLQKKSTGSEANKAVIEVA